MANDKNEKQRASVTSPDIDRRDVIVFGGSCDLERRGCKANGKQKRNSNEVCAHVRVGRCYELRGADIFGSLEDHKNKMDRATLCGRNIAELRPIDRSTAVWLQRPKYD